MSGAEMDSFDDLVNTHGFTTLPVWLDKAIQGKNPHVTLGLANSQLYKLKLLDKALGTVSLYEKIAAEVN